MPIALFNQTSPVLGNSIEDPSQDAIEGSLNLRQVSLEDAMRYGGPITREALGVMNFVGDRKNIIVDTKVHFLMPGMIPAIPGWHTDGVPRGTELDPAGAGKPSITAQIEADERGITAPRYHLLVTGTHCPTRFMENPFRVKVVDGPDLYKKLSMEVNTAIAQAGKHHKPVMVDTPASTVVTWDWWNIHQAQESMGRGWRYLIRVAETDYIEPRTNPADFIRTQNQVYLSTEFGW